MKIILHEEYTERKEIEEKAIQVIAEYLRNKNQNKYSMVDDSIFGKYNNMFEKVIDIMKRDKENQDDNYPFLWSLKEKLKPFLIEDKVKRIMEISLCHRHMEDAMSRLLKQSFRGQDEESFKFFDGDLAKFAKIIKFSFEGNRKEIFITQDELNELYANSKSAFKDVDINDDSKCPELSYRDLLMKRLYDEILTIIKEIEEIEKA
jgi:phosphate uptake regulator